MKEIKLTQGKFALVDNDMFEELNQFKWCAAKDGNTFYAVRNIYNNRKRKTIRMHRQILGLIDSKIQCDHKNHEGLDNQKSNLRSCTIAENQRNQRPRIGCSSKYKGVYFNKLCKKWMAYIKVENKSTTIGLFTNEIEAAKAYDKAAKVHHKEFAYTNF